MTVPGSLYTPLIRKIRSSGHVIEGSARTTLGDLIRTPSSASNLKTNVIEIIFKVTLLAKYVLILAMVDQCLQLQYCVIQRLGTIL